MNWLAHLFLSEPAVDFQLGNLLADLIPPNERERMCAEFNRGMRCHLAIDAFTDSHPAVLRSRARLEGPHRRFAGVLVDVFHDHLLACDWSHYSSESLEQFVHRFHAVVSRHPIALPVDAAGVLERMIAEDRLLSYRTMRGVEAALRRLSARMSERLGRACALEQAVPQLAANEPQLAADFAQFFPELQCFVHDWLAGNPGIGLEANVA